MSFENVQLCSIIVLCVYSIVATCKWIQYRSVYHDMDFQILQLQGQLLIAKSWKDINSKAEVPHPTKLPRLGEKIEFPPDIPSIPSKKTNVYFEKEADFENAFEVAGIASAFSQLNNNDNYTSSKLIIDIDDNKYTGPVEACTYVVNDICESFSNE